MIKKILFFILFTVTTIAYGDETGHFDVIFNNGNFIAVGTSAINKPQIDISQDGIHWQSANIDTPPPSAGYHIISVACNKNICVAIFIEGDSILYSNDNGLNWKYVEHAVYDQGGSNIIYANRFVMTDGANILYSYDGLSWNKANIQDLPDDFGFISIAYNGNMYVAIALKIVPFNTDVRYAVSSDGINWSLIDPQKIPVDISGSFTVITANNTFYFSNYDSVGLLYTTNFLSFGINNPTYAYETIEFHNNIMFSHINNSKYTFLSNDLGKTWYPTDGTPTPIDISYGLNNTYAYGNNIYVYTHGTSTRYSYDAIHWNSAVDKQK